MMRLERLAGDNYQLTVTNPDCPQFNLEMSAGPDAEAQIFKAFYKCVRLFTPGDSAELRKDGQIIRSARFVK